MQPIASIKQALSEAGDVPLPASCAANNHLVRDGWMPVADRELVTFGKFLTDHGFLMSSRSKACRRSITRRPRSALESYYQLFPLTARIGDFDAAVLGAAFVGVVGRHRHGLAETLEAQPRGATPCAVSHAITDLARASESV